MSHSRGRRMYNRQPLYVFDTLVMVLGYLTAEELQNAAGVSIFWNDCIRSEAADNRLYKVLYDALSRSSIAKVAPSSINFQVGVLDIDAIKKILDLAKVDTGSCTTHANYRACFIAYLIFKAKPILAHSRLRSGMKNRQIMYPDWTHRLPTWKASYYFLQADLKRNFILESELCGIKWHFAYRQDPHEHFRQFFYCIFDNTTHILRNVLYSREESKNRLQQFFTSNLDDMMQQLDYLYDFLGEMFMWEFAWKVALGGSFKKDPSKSF